MVKLKDQVTKLMVLFLITASQVGVGVLGFQSVINKYAGHDAWISVILAGLSINIIIWLMYKLLNNNDKGDIVAIHQFSYGKWVGSFFSIIFSVYLFLIAVVVLRSYLEVIQVWMFPNMKLWALLLLLIPLLYYIVTSEFRIVVGVCFLGVVYPSILIWTLLFPLKYSQINYILPVLDHSIIEIMQSSSLAILSFLGITTLLVYYPFVREAKKSQKFAHFGNLYTTFLYVVICLVSYIYYNQSELKDVIWPTLGLWKIIELPFLARFEFIGIATLFFSILPNVVLYTWTCARTLNRVSGISRKKIAVVLLCILFVACLLIEGREGVKLLNDTVSKIGLVLLYIYIPGLCLINSIRRKVKKNAS